MDNGFVTEEQIAHTLATQLNLPFVDLKKYNVKVETVRRLTETQSRRFRALSLDEHDDKVLVGMVDPTDLLAYDELSRLLKSDLDLAIVAEEQL